MANPNTPSQQNTQKSPNEGDETPNGVEGEGSYTATRRYNAHIADHQRNADVDALAEQAREAVEGDEGAELEQAEEAGRKGPRDS